MDSEFGTLILEAFGAYQKDDEGRLRELYHPDVEVHADAGILNSGTFYGWEGFRRWVSQWEEAWETITYEPHEIVDFGQNVAVVSVRTTGKGAGSGIELVQEFFYVFRRRDGLLTHFHLYPKRAQALEVAERFAAEDSG